MNIAARWKKMTSRLLFNGLPDSSSNAPPDPSADLSLNHPASNPPGDLPPKTSASLSLRERLRDVFPPGLESNSKSIGRGSYTFSPHDLYEVFARERDNQHVGETIVKSAWYGKQKKSAGHEFILIQVEDLMIPGLENCLVIDRNQGKSSSPLKVSKALTRFSSLDATVAFRVSHDGDLSRLVEECQLTPYRLLEHIHLQPNEPLQFLKLVTLVNHISDLPHGYNLLDANCYWFAGLVWECMVMMCPAAQHQIFFPGKRGRTGFVRTIPNPVQVQNVLREVQRTIESFNPGIAQIEDDSANEPEEDMGGDMREVRLKALATDDLEQVR